MTERYFGDVLGSYANGVQLDLRVKLAVDFLKSPWAGQHVHCDEPAALATAALDLASDLMALAHERGLVAPLPDSDELSAPQRRHIRRSVRAQVVSQLAGPEIAAEESPKLSVAGHAALMHQ